ncbi:hypothetical protein [Mesorhizobium sp. M1E.F.Ca.ET.063.01.1.1]|uniref:hypothetical protein n=1 Tax=Mesorhizobium sp. M1E.F.Ca.ET.063.01.1.1 TaxID=2496750 RepID=UPI000FCC8A29|nr:hypothetical protein [Mesorhizobium sp. M1E.F.Ca.ET.063.01.1.1]RUW85128.1 hypothetical protein EOA29_06280 [Mesorhizobium sp. M1E.F.Ca.ET.063.01.1.1]
MADDKAKTQRRVYVLPVELVDRITAYQTDMGLPSEVDAARKLLDDALNRRDTAQSITRRFQERLKDTRVLADVARDVLIGHPLLSTLSMGSNQITFTLTTGDKVVVRVDGTASIEDREQSGVHLDKEGNVERDFSFRPGLIRHVDP